MTEVVAPMEIKDPNYRVWFDPSTSTVFLEGSLRLNTREYEPISDLLEQAAGQCPGTLVVNVHDLAFCNSSGINALYKFAISMRKRGDRKLVVRAGDRVAWQAKSLPNMTRFCPGAVVEGL